MFSYLSQAFQKPSFCVPNGHNLDEQSAEDISLFGDLFLPQSEIEYSDFLDGLVPEFNIDGFLGDVLNMPSPEISPPGSRKLSKLLASTQANDLSGADLEDTDTTCSENINSRSVLKLEARCANSMDSSLKKRPLTCQEDTQAAVEFNQPCKSMNDFDRQTFVRNQVVSLVLNLIDRKKLAESQVLNLDAESINMLSNFSFMIYSQNLSSDTLQKDLEFLNAKISYKLEKKKRNEERIKYVFKRVNKIILKKFMDEHELQQDQEPKAMHQILAQYFGLKVNHHAGGSPITDIGSASNRYFTLLFKPSNMYRNDLKDVFNFPSYLKLFKEVIEKEFVSEFTKKREVKIQEYLKDLRNEMFYCTDKADPSILKKKISRLPWSLAEVQKGILLFQDIFKMH